MIKDNKFVLILLCLVAILIPSNAFGRPDYYRKHIVLVVDGTKKTQGQNLKVIGDELLTFLNGEVPINNPKLKPDFAFDPKQDFLEVFIYGMQGDMQNSRSGDASKLYYLKGKVSEEKLFNKTIDYLVHPFAKTEEPVDLSIWWERELSKIFKSNNSQFSFGYGLSAFLPNAVLPFIDKSIPAQEYYIICVSTFQAGLSGQNATHDIETLGQIYGEGSNSDYPIAHAFNSWLKDKGDLYSVANWIDVVKGNAMKMGVSAIGKQYVLKSAARTAVFISSNITLSQNNLDRKSFTIKPLTVSFPGDDDLDINNIKLVVYKDGKQIGSKQINKYEYDKLKKEFILTPGSITLSEDINRPDDVSLSFFFTPRTVTESDVLPYIFIADRKLTGNDILLVNDKQRNMIITFIAIAIILLALTLMVWRSRLVKLNAIVHNFTTRYSLTTAQDGTIELPCWFVAKNQQSVGIKIDGDVFPKNRYFTIPRRNKLYVTIDEVNVPDGVMICVNDNRDMISSEGKYYLIPLEDKRFKFTLNFWIERSEFDMTQPQKVRIKLRYKTETFLPKLTSKIQYHPSNADDAELIEFFITPEIGVSWMGIDPGTSGSCVAVGRGGTIKQPNIFLVEKEGETIIPSRLIFDRSTFNNIIDAVPGIDYTYGYEAGRRWKAAVRKNQQSFQSIKKLLGYQNGDNNKIKIRIPKIPEPVYVSGMELAQLLVRGILKDTDDYINSLPETRKKLIVPSNEPIKRAVVAIPNNYTLPKTLDMVRSVALSGRFEEVRPIYEAEAILCNYLSKTVGEITTGRRNIIVYDMGGATINLTIFSVEYTSKNGSTYYNIKTLGRIGYAVGGDNIDYALMTFIFSLTDWKNDKAGARKYQEENKVEILDSILSLKKNLIIASNSNKSKEMLASFDAFNDYVKSVTGRIINDSNFTKYVNEEGFSNYVFGRLTESSSQIRDYVKFKIKEVTSEIVKYPDIKNLDKVDSIIFSGRSVLFPNIQQWVMNGLKSKFPTLSKWEGLTAQEVKTAVAYGACWYGTFNALVTLDNSRVASAYGFKLTENGTPRFVSLVDQNVSFNGNSSIESNTHLTSNFASDGNIVEFYQVMGSTESKDLFATKNRYKINKLGEIPINIATEEIKMEVKRSNQVDFGITLETGDKISKTDIEVMDRDITDENDEAYIFASYSVKSFND